MQILLDGRPHRHRPVHRYYLHRKRFLQQLADASALQGSIAGMPPTPIPEASSALQQHSTTVATILASRLGEVTAPTVVMPMGWQRC